MRSSANHGTQLVGHFLVDADGIVRWVQIEALDEPESTLHLPDRGGARRRREQPRTLTCNAELDERLSTGTATRPASRDPPRPLRIPRRRG